MGAGAKFEPGQKVAWSHAIAPMHGAKSVMKTSAVLAQDRNARLATVIKHDEETPIFVWVKLEDTGEERTLGDAELIAVED